VQTRPTTS